MTFEMSQHLLACQQSVGSTSSFPLISFFFLLLAQSPCS